MTKDAAYFWSIINKLTGDVWSDNAGDEGGWVSPERSCGELFTDNERNVRDLPANGKWVRA